jgi:NifU-like protein involved in Fe-S cluster formation
MAKPDAEAEEENQVCGDRLHVWLRIEGETVVEMTWKAEGCALRSPPPVPPVNWCPA